MFENLSVFENRYEELNLKLYDPTVAADREQYAALMKEHKEITPIVEHYRALKKAEADAAGAQQLLDDPDSDKELRQKILQMDKHRSHYYTFYTDQTWGDKLNYDLCVNTTHTSIKDMVATIARLF